MAWSPALTALNHVLAGLYPLVEDSYRIVDAASIEPKFVAFQRKAIDNWHQILSEAEKRNKVMSLVHVALLEFPTNPILIQASKGELANLAGPVMTDSNWRTRIVGNALEKLMGKHSTLLPISFLEVGLDRARSVARIRLASGELGTGFLIPNNVLITNNHVLPDAKHAADAVAQFNYQQSSMGLNLELEQFKLAPDEGFLTSEEDDFTLVKIAGDANAVWGNIQLVPIEIEQVERVNIIQHPSGGPKQIALYHNVVVYADASRVQYLTDTLPGSSGSPVFNNLWQIVALHHSGGWITEPGTKEHVFRNEGININIVREAVNAANFV